MEKKPMEFEDVWGFDAHTLHKLFMNKMMQKELKTEAREFPIGGEVVVEEKENDRD